MKNAFLLLCCPLSFFLLVLPAYANISDAPHNLTNDINCSSCHSFSLWWQFSPINYNSTPDSSLIVNNVCLSCHGPSGNEIQENTHSSDAMGTTSAEWQWSRDCVDCHDPHFQGQLEWVTADPSLAEQLYLVTGTIDNGSTLR